MTDECQLMQIPILCFITSSKVELLNIQLMRMNYVLSTPGIMLIQQMYHMGEKIRETNLLITNKQTDKHTETQLYINSTDTIVSKISN